MADMTMIDLSLTDRLTLLGVLPEKVGSFREMRDVKQIREAIQIPDDHREALSFRQEGNTIKWDKDKEAELEPARGFEFTDSQLSTVGSAFLLMETQGRIPTNNQFINLYEKFEDHIGE
jgi:hypothetical protein